MGRVGGGLGGNRRQGGEEDGGEGGGGQRLGVILSAGCTLGCSLVSGPAVGQIERCEIWYPEGWEWVRQHELQHCKGYADLF